MKVRAAALHQVGAGLDVETLDLAPPRAGEVLVQIHAAGVCHSDYHVISGQAQHALPCVLGHEGAGIVVDVGDGVTHVAPGDHVVLSWIPYCNECFYCSNEQTHLCRAFVEPLWAGTMLDGTSRLSKDGKDYLHLSMLACWADHAVVPEKSCVVLSKKIPFDVAALLGCAVTTGVGAAVNRAKVKPGSCVAIFGVGGVGLSIIMGAALAGAEKIIAIDVAPQKQDMAEDLGATHFLMAGPDNVEQVKALTGGRGADYAFEAVGNVKLQRLCLDAVRPGGMLVFVGMAGNKETMDLPSTGITRDEKMVTGSIFGSSLTDRDFNRFGELFLEGKLPINKLISKHYRLDEINEACEAMLSGGDGRGVIVFEHEGGTV